MFNKYPYPHQELNNSGLGPEKFYKIEISSSCVGFINSTAIPKYQK